MMSSPVAGIDPHQDTFTVGDRRPQRCRAHPRHVRQQRRRLPRRRSSCSTRMVSSRSVSRAQRAGARTSRSRSSRPGFDAREVPAATLARSSVERGVWTRPTSSTRSPPLGRCSPSRRSVRCKRSRSTTRWWPRSKPCWSTAGCWSRSARWCFTTSRTRWRSCRPRSVTGSARTARSRLAWLRSPRTSTSPACRRRQATIGCRG